MAYAEAKTVGADAIPVIDIGALRDGSDPDRVARALHAASSGVGFLYVANHGIPETVIEAARTEAFAFFRGPAETRQAVAVSGAHRGWLGRGGAKMQDDAKPDLKESFIWGWQDANGQTPEDHPLRGPNRWPAAQPALEAAAMAYLTAAHGVAHRLMEGFARGLGLAPGFFTATATLPLSRCSFVYYPAQPPEAGVDQFGVGPHTDFGVLTVLAQD
ncbi:MAG: 2-oxoglutarate and iron-dependent oxygenase domain-containing protein, partial [Pseudomonadota bacterium]